MIQPSPIPLRDELTARGYTAIPLRLNAVNHFEVDVMVNTCTGRFVLDTGASMTCLDKSAADRFRIALQPSTEKAAGAGQGQLDVEMGVAEQFALTQYGLGEFQFAVVDFSHLNRELLQRGTQPVDGVLGADILRSRAGILDYESATLFLR
jgi:hypothetical protein